MGLTKIGELNIPVIEYLENCDKSYDYFYCPPFPTDTYAMSGRKIANVAVQATTQKAVDKHDLNAKLMALKNRNINAPLDKDNRVSAPSIFIVEEGQCLIISINQFTKEACAEPGIYSFNEDSEGSLILGGLNPLFLEESFREFSNGLPTKSDMENASLANPLSPTAQIHPPQVYYVNIKDTFVRNVKSNFPREFTNVESFGMSIDLLAKCQVSVEFVIRDPIRFYSRFSEEICPSNIKGSLSMDKSRDGILDKKTKNVDCFNDLDKYLFVTAKELGLTFDQIEDHSLEILFRFCTDNADYFYDRGWDVTAFKVSDVDIPLVDQVRIRTLREDIPELMKDTSPITSPISPVKKTTWSLVGGKAVWRCPRCGKDKNEGKFCENCGLHRNALQI